jgi:hypothetical protein
MNFSTFIDTLSENVPPADLSVHLRALWYDRKGEWDKSHATIQDVADTNASWIHAYLHRKEGDRWNADYWYNKAGRKRPLISLDDEWEQIVKAFL